jgi:hypothetical protein
MTCGTRRVAVDRVGCGREARSGSRAGHASVAFTLQRYGHLYPDSEDDLMGALDVIGRNADPAGNVVSLPARRA